MNLSKLNPYKTPIIAGSFGLAFTVAVFSFFTGVSQSLPELPKQPETVQTEIAEVDLKIKGNRKSKIYHLRGCPNYADLKESNIVWFKTADDAEKAGFRMARNC